MDTAIIVALISAFGAIIAALIAIIPHFLRKHQAPPVVPIAKPETSPELTPGKQLVEPVSRSFAGPHEQSSGSVIPGPVGHQTKGQRVMKPLLVAEGTSKPQTPPGVDELLSRQSPGVRQLVRELRSYLENDGGKPYTTRKNKGDLRFSYTGSNHFCVIGFRRSHIVLELRVGEVGLNNVPDLRRYPDRQDLGVVHLREGEPVPKRVLEWIAVAKRFTRVNYG